MVGSVVKAIGVENGRLSNDDLVLGILLLALGSYGLSLLHFSVRHPFHVTGKWMPRNLPEGVDEHRYTENLIRDVLTLPREFTKLDQVATIYFKFDQAVADFEVQFKPDAPVEIIPIQRSNQFTYDSATNTLRPAVKTDWMHEFFFPISLRTKDGWETDGRLSWRIDVTDRGRRIFQIQCDD
ncbi:hypothetical protein ACFQE1_03175 [Halobium palmae]|uniref:Uncharacterized protein n=1 Tax=Halobium palmae TaxID=1776492 RepID=A0ABD5RVL5_9EURY